MGSNPVYFPCAKVKLDLFKLLLFIQNGIVLLYYVYNAQDAKRYIYISQHINDVIVMS